MRPKRFGSNLGRAGKLRLSELINCSGADLSLERRLESLKGFFRALTKTKHWRGLKPWKTKFGIRAARSQTHQRLQRKNQRKERALELRWWERRQFRLTRREGERPPEERRLLRRELERRLRRPRLASRPPCPRRIGFKSLGNLDC